MSEQVVKRYSLSEFADQYTHPIGPGTYISATDYDALRAEAEARIEREQIALAHALDAATEAERLSTELEEARGLLRLASSAMAREGSESALAYKIDIFLTATPVQEVQCGHAACKSLGEPHPFCNFVQKLEKAEQGGRQEAACWVPRACLDKLRNGRNNSPAVLTDGPAEFNDTPLYTIPQPSQDVRGLAASLYQACGAYDMPERILDALSAAANGEPFARMIDGLLPCVPPSDQDVRALLSADDVRDACADAVSVFAEVANADQCREVAEYMREVLLAQIAHRQAQRKGESHDT